MRELAIRDGAAPELGGLLAGLFMMIDARHAIVVHVTAANHREGATTVAREIAAAAASAGWCQVAFLDAHADGRRLASPGLLELVEQGEAPRLHPGRINAAPVAVANLSTTGRAITRVDGVRRLYDVLRARYTLVVVDSPPVLCGHDVAPLAAIADGTIMVVEAERTRVADATRARDTLEQLGASVIGVVLNRDRRRVPELIGRRL